MTDYTIEQMGQELVVTLASDLTASVVAGLQGSLKERLGQETTGVVFDLGETQVLDSSGVGLLIATSNTMAKRQGKVRVIQVSEEIHHLLRSMRLVSRLNATPRGGSQ